MDSSNRGPWFAPNPVKFESLDASGLAWSHIQSSWSEEPCTSFPQQLGVDHLAVWILPGCRIGVIRETSSVSAPQLQGLPQLDPPSTSSWFTTSSSKAVRTAKILQTVACWQNRDSGFMPQHGDCGCARWKHGPTSPPSTLRTHNHNVLPLIKQGCENSQNSGRLSHPGRIAIWDLYHSMVIVDV